MKILVIFTGGTIGSAEENGWISNDSRMNRLLLKNYFNTSNDNSTEFDVCEPYRILSENLSASELNMLSACVAEHLPLGYDGIIITHGTDSLQYTAAMLSYMFTGCKIPIVLVSSDYTLEDGRGNGNANFLAAVKFIESSLRGGVFVSYKNSDASRTSIHIASRLTQYTEAASKLYSIDNEPFAFYDEAIIKNPSFVMSEESDGIGVVKLLSMPQILVVESRPEDTFSYLLDDIQAVILRPYHSGTLATDSEPFKRFCLSAAEKNIPVFLVNVRDGARYSSSKLFEELSIEVLPYCSFTSIYAKCWLALSLSCDVREFVRKPLAQEFCSSI